MINDLVVFVNERNITPNQLYFLWCKHYKIRPREINPHTELRFLIDKGYINDDKITPLGLEIVSLLSPPESKVKKDEPLSMDYIERYLSLFPKGKLPSGKQARGDKKNIQNNFNWFFKNYSYSWDVILKATAYYVDEYESKGYLYMRTSQYFISKMMPDKTRESELANYCAVIVSGEDILDKPHFNEKVV